MILPIVGDLTVGVYKNPIWRLQFFVFGHNIASDCSPIPWVFKTVLNSKIKLVAATWGAGSQIIHNRQTLIFVCRGMKYPICHLQFFLFGDNIASACSPIPWEFKTVLNS